MRTSRMQSFAGKFMRFGLVAVAVAAAGVGALAFQPGSASAGTITSSSGYPGPSSITEPGVTCTWGGSSIRVAVKPPNIWARDNYAGMGNDWQWVHFRARLVDSAGRTLATQAWSPYVKAFDNATAKWSGTQDFTTTATMTRVQIDIEWWSATAKLGSVTQQVSKYWEVGVTGYMYMAPYGSVPYTIPPFQNGVC